MAQNPPRTWNFLVLAAVVLTIFAIAAVIFGDLPDEFKLPLALAFGGAACYYAAAL